MTAGHRAQASLDCFAHFARLFDFLTVTVERFDDLRVFRTGNDVQAGKIVRLYRPTVGIVSGNAGFLGEITLIVEHHSEERQVVLLRCAVHRWHRIVVERAVADQAHHRPFRIGRLYAERSRKARAQTADTAGKIRSRLHPVEVAVHRQTMGNGLFDDHRVGWQNLA